jgi:hypothetical protein
MTARRYLTALLLMLVLAPLARAATVHAFLDRNHVSLGDTVTLNIQSSGAIGNPDLSPLRQDFQVLGASRSSNTQIVNGKVSTISQLGIALKPLHAGTLAIPALSIGSATTSPLTLHVAAAPSGGHGQVGDPVFMEASVLSSSPWVGQQTVYTVRLFYQPGVDGSLGNPQADGARLVRLDRDHRYMVRRNGYAYQVIERSWALIPDRSGAITVQGPSFSGRNLGAGNLNSLFNSPNSPFNNPNALLNGPFPGLGSPVHAAAPEVSINARPAPAGAGKPWLPARDLKLALTGLPAGGNVQAGVPLTVTLSIRATGMSADALPEPALPAIAGARVYPDQTRDSTDDSGEWLVGKRTRSFAIVPDRNGKLTIPAITLNWWDVVHDHAEQARLPVHTLQVSGAVAGSGMPASPASTGNPVVGARGNVAAPAIPDTGAHRPHGGPPGSSTPWRELALASLVLWLVAVMVALVWWFSRRHAARVASMPHSPGGEAAAAASPSAGSGVSSAKVNLRVLQKQTLDAARAGDAIACEHALLAWARAMRPDVANAAALRDALSDSGQRVALDALQRARWRGGDAASACAVVVEAFAHGISWRGEDGKTPRAGGSDLPPLYPL